MKNQRRPLRVKLIVWWSRGALFFEQILGLLFPAIVFPALYLALALTGLFESTGDPWRLILASMALAGFAFYLHQNWPKVRWPNTQASERRAETDANLALGTLSALHDHPETGDGSASAALWKAHQQQLSAKAKFITAQPTRAVLAAKDSWGLRVLVVLALFTGVIFAGPAWQTRLGTALHPGLLLATDQNVAIEAWLNPPEYAGLPPIFFNAAEPQQLVALPGTEFVIRVVGARRAPLLRARGETIARTRLASLGNGVFEGRVTITGTSTLTLSGGAKGTWSIDARADLPPMIRFEENPEANEIDELTFSFIAEDDFGVENVQLRISSETEGYFEKTDIVALILPKAKKLEQQQSLDLTQHILAGLPVRLQLEALDGAGQTTRSEPVFVHLPEKLFIKPLAKAIAEQRHLVMRDTRSYAPIPEPKPAELEAQAAMLGGDMILNERPLARLSLAPSGVQRTSALLRSVMRAPQLANQDPVVWIGLAYVSGRLLKARGQNDLTDLNPEMWQIALRAEGGELESAAAALKLAEKALQTALLLSAPPSELHRLSQKYEMAVKRYLQALARQALDEEGGAGGMGNAMSADQLQEMLDALQALTETGATGDARALLKALAAMLQNLRLQMATGQGGDGEEDIVAEAMRKALEELGEMLGKQREVLDETQQQTNTENGSEPSGAQQPAAGGAGSMQDLADKQGQLQNALQELGKSGAVANSGAGQALDDAAQAMGEAAQALIQGEGEPALAAGQRALSQLRQGAETLAGEMLDHQEGEENRGQRDPFGRQSNSGSMSADGTEIPDLIDPQQARKILQEIRRRAAEQQRTREELDYLERLLERF